jgi:hypothetical protein
MYRHVRGPSYATARVSTAPTERAAVSPSSTDSNTLRTHSSTHNTTLCDQASHHGQDYTRADTVG